MGGGAGVLRTVLVARRGELSRIRPGAPVGSDIWRQFRLVRLMGQRHPRFDSGLCLGDRHLRMSLLQPDPSGHYHQWPVSLHEAPRLYLQKFVVLDDFTAVSQRRACASAATRAAAVVVEWRLFPARMDRGASSLD